MTKQDRYTRMENRLDRIQTVLANSDLAHAIKQLGDKLTLENFGKRAPEDVAQLSMYREAEALSMGILNSEDFTGLVREVYARIQDAFKAYQAKQANATARAPLEAPQESIDEIV